MSRTYGDLWQRTVRMANGLAAEGVGQGDRVAVLATNTADYIPLVFALGLLRAIWVPLNFRLSARELAYIVNDSAASVVIHTPDQLGIAQDIEGQANAPCTFLAFSGRSLSGLALDSLVEQSNDQFEFDPARPADVFAIMYTSGTTGNPKGVVLTHEAFVRGTEHLATAARIVPGERHLQVIPQFHAGGQIYQLAHLMLGATIVIAPRFEPELILDAFEHLGIESAGFVPTMIVTLLEHPRVKRLDFSRLRRVMYGGSPIPEDRLALALELTGAGFQQTYGQTEAGVIVSVLDAADHVQALRERSGLLQSCGRPIHGYDVRVVDDEGRETAGRAVGELTVAGDSLMAEYLNLPQATEKTLRDGWLHTGDMCWRDEHGYLYLVDRRTDLIISGGENVYPVEVEHVISMHPGVLEVAVIGVPDERWGEAVKAIVVLRSAGAASEAELREFCRIRLAGYKVPKSVDLVPAIPRNASGKILKRQLREPYWQGRARRI